MGLTTNLIGANVLDICDASSTIFPTSGEVSSCSGYCYDDASYPTDLAAAFNLTPATSSDLLEQFDLAGAGIPMTLPGFVNVGGCYASYSGVFDDTVPSNSFSFLDQQSVVGGYGSPAAAMGGVPGGVCGEPPAIIAGGLLPEFGMNPPEMEFQGEKCGMYGPDSVYTSADFHVLNETQQQMMKGGCESPVSGIASDMSTLEESTFKVGRLSVEERKEKIHRYMKKRNERNFTKKIKYACRKTLADSRPRVRGRFAKNDEFGEAAKTSCGHHDDEEEVERRVCTGSLYRNVVEQAGVKEEEMLDSSDIYPHISGVNSFKCNYPIQSWM